MPGPARWMMILTKIWKSLAPVDGRRLDQLVGIDFMKLRIRMIRKGVIIPARITDQ